MQFEFYKFFVSIFILLPHIGHLIIIETKFPKVFIMASNGASKQTTEPDFAKA